MSWTVATVAGSLGLPFRGEDREISGINTLENARPDQISFLANAKYAQYLPLTKAGAVIVTAEYADSVPCAIISENPYVDFGRAVALFARPQGGFSGVSDRAFVHEEAALGADVTVYPFAYVGPRTAVGAGSVLFPGCYVGEDCVLGQGCVLYPNVTLMAGTVLGKGCIIHAGVVLGADGFGFARLPGGGIQKIPQIGTVTVGDDVEIGANAAVDRAVLGATRIGSGTKIDNLVQVGHNVTMGEECFIVSQVGISGSTQIGSRTTLAGQVGVAGHLKIGSDVTVGPQSGVAKDIPDGMTCGGSPCVDGKTFMRTLALMPKFPEMHKRIGRLEDEIQALKSLLAKKEDQ